MRAGAYHLDKIIMAEKLIVEGFKQFGGKHCQTTSLKNVSLY